MKTLAKTLVPTALLVAGGALANPIDWPMRLHLLLMAICPLVYASWSWLIQTRSTSWRLIPQQKNLPNCRAMTVR